MEVITTVTASGTVNPGCVLTAHDIVDLESTNVSGPEWNTNDITFNASMKGTWSESCPPITASLNILRNGQQFESHAIDAV
jgi:hypothetical protein